MTTVPSEPLPAPQGIDKLAAALAKAQGAMAPAKRDKQNPFYKSSYADLASVWDVIRKPLSDNGLSIMQIPGYAEDGAVELRTILAHSSGQTVDSVYAMKPLKADPQGYGSCLTYMRRYAISAIVGVCSEEDDDGNGASAAPTKPAQFYNKPAAAPPPAAVPSAVKSQMIADVMAHATAKGFHDPSKGTITKFILNILHEPPFGKTEIDTLDTLAALRTAALAAVDKWAADNATPPNPQEPPPQADPNEVQY